MAVIREQQSLYERANSILQNRTEINQTKEVLTGNLNAAQVALEIPTETVFPESGDLTPLYSDTDKNAPPASYPNAWSSLSPSTNRPPASITQIKPEGKNARVAFMDNKGGKDEAYYHRMARLDEVEKLRRDTVNWVMNEWRARDKVDGELFATLNPPAGDAGLVLHSNGKNNQPTWRKVHLVNDIEAVLWVPHGGTGLDTVASNALLYGNGSNQNDLGVLTHGIANQVLRSINDDGKLGWGQVQTADIADSAVTNAKLANNSVTSGKIQNGTITNDDIADNTIVLSDKTTGNLPISRITNLQSTINTINNTLNNKSDLGHTHSISDIYGLDEILDEIGEVDLSGYLPLTGGQLSGELTIHSAGGQLSLRDSVGEAFTIWAMRSSGTFIASYSSNGRIFVTINGAPAKWNNTGGYFEA